MSGTTDSQRINLTREQAAKFVEVMHQIQPFRVPLARAVANGTIMLCSIDRGAPYPRRDLEASTRRPIVTLIGDDDYETTGPKAFPAAGRLARYWANAIMLHAAGGETHHYDLVVAQAALSRRVLVVETDSAHADEWRDFLGNGRRVPLLCVLPTGGVHPVMPERSDA